MRKKYAIINTLVNAGAYLITLIPVFWVRKAIIATLGEEFLGLTSLFQNLIGFLSLAELGVGAAVMFALYKPIAEKNYSTTNAYLSYFQNAYVKISSVIAVVGIALMLFFPQIIKTTIPRQTVFLAFLIFLQSTLLSYWFSSRITLFMVSQKGYVVSGLASGFRLVTLAVQIGTLYLFKNLFIFLIIQVVFDAIYLIVINYLAAKHFPWIGQPHQALTQKEKKGLYTNTAAVFCHKMGSFVILGSDSIIISVFISLAAVGRYSNYNILFSTATNIVEKMFDGVAAGIGNILATEENQYSYIAHKRLMFMNFVIVSFLSILLGCVSRTFVTLWVGREFCLDSTVVWLLVFNFYFRGMRSSVEKFKQGAGLYVQDWWSPVCEAILNLGLALLFVRRWGIAGVLFATAMSNILVVFWVKPYIVYRDIFKQPLRKYFIAYARYFIYGSITLGICYGIENTILPNASIVVSLFRGIGVICLVVPVIYWVLFRKTEEYCYFKSNIVSLNKLGH